MNKYYGRIIDDVHLENIYNEIKKERKTDKQN